MHRHLQVFQGGSTVHDQLEKPLTICRQHPMQSTSDLGNHFLIALESLFQYGQCQLILPQRQQNQSADDSFFRPLSRQKRSH